MPKGIETFVDEGFAEITVADKQLRGEVLNKILEHTPVQLVEKDTRKGRHVVYRIPEGNARAAGLVDDPTEGRIPLKADQGFAQDLVDADPQIDGRGDSWGEYRTILPTVGGSAYQAMPTAPGNGVQDGNLNGVEPQDANGKIRAELRPNKNVASSVPQPPAGASTTAADLQAKIRASRPVTPSDYAPQRVPLDQRVPSAQGTIAATVDREPSGPAEPPTGFGIGPNAGRVVEGQPGGEAGATTTSAPDIITEQHDADRAVAAPSTTTTASVPAKAPAKAPAKKAPAKKAAAAKKAPAKKAAPKPPEE